MFKFDQHEKVKDTLTGATGRVVARTEWDNGCLRYAVQPEGLHDGKPLDTFASDEQNLVSVGKTNLPKRIGGSERKGGPPAGHRRDPQR